MSVVVSDTTPLNYLILIGSVDILPRMFGKVIVPPAVVRELSHPRTPAPVAAWARHLPEWIEVRAPRINLHLGLGAGEEEAISLAAEFRVAILMDERRARAVAEERGLLVLGTLAILNVGDARGWLEFEAAVSRLRATNFRVNEALLEKVRAAIRARKQP